MKILNLHAHKLNFNALNYNNEKSYEIKPNKIFEANSDRYYLSFKCTQCDNFYNDYKSNREDYYPSYFSRQSIFSSKNAIQDFYIRDSKIYEFVEFCDYKLVGTKNEIISYICEEYNKLNMQYNNSQKRIKNLDSNIKNKEKDFLKAQENLQNEKKERNKIDSNLNKIQSEKMDLSNCLKKEQEKSSKLNFKITELEMRQEKLTKKKILL